MTFFRPTPYIKVLPLPSFLVPHHLLRLPPALVRPPTPRKRLTNLALTLRRQGVSIPPNLRITHFKEEHKQVKIQKHRWLQGVRVVWRRKGLKEGRYPLSWGRKLGGGDIARRGPARDLVELIRRDN
ncbi:hypothetical protein BT69DRAFT_1334405 [Atractiella rhizophila]|nr:hypothetical protein BT69DRAFT_1334405 [Atractiella rhizophila]